MMKITFGFCSIIRRDHFGRMRIDWILETIPYKRDGIEWTLYVGAIGSFVTLHTALGYPEDYNPALCPDHASFDLHYDIGLSEYLAPSRAAGFSALSAKRQYREMADGHHELRSRWLKPSGSLAVGAAQYGELLPEEIRHQIIRSVYVDGRMVRVPIDVASDGLTGYVRLSSDDTNWLQ